MAAKAEGPNQALERALAELGRGDRTAAFESLLDAWRQRPAPAIAELIDGLSPALEAERPAIALGGNKQLAWNEALANATTADLPRLYEALPDTRVGLAYARLAQLRDRRADPRLARWLWAWIRDVPFKGAASRQFYIEACAQLVAMGDPRFDADILAARSGDHTTRHYTVARLTGVGSRTALRAFLALAGEVERRRATPLDADAQVIVDQLAAKIAQVEARVDADQQTGARLLAAVHADPRDDGARLVYADYLQRTGDPRGEFIALQLARHGTPAKPSKRERELLKQYGEAWLDGLEPFVLKSGREFRRGFLATCRYCHTRVEPNPVGLGAWATIEELDGSAHTYMSGTARILAQPHMRALRVVRGVTVEDVQGLANLDHPVAIESLHLRNSYGDLLAALSRASWVAKLRTLDLRDCVLRPAQIAAIEAAFPELEVIAPS